MARGVNIYFDQVGNRPEQNLLEDLVIESIQIHGINCYYIPRTLVNEDTLFGEDTLSEFKYATPIEMYLESMDGFTGDGDFISQFGLEIRDSMSLTVSKKRFKETMEESTYSDITRPREGDLIYFPISNGVFEIKFVEHEVPQFYQHGKLYVYTMSAELFNYSQEDIETGFTDIDSVDSGLDNSNDISNDLFADNDDIQDEAGTDGTSGVINYLETDPFSDGNY